MMNHTHLAAALNATVNAKISARILKNMAEGCSLKNAIDAVMGPNAYMQLVDELWNALRAQEVK